MAQHSPRGPGADQGGARAAVTQEEVYTQEHVGLLGSFTEPWYAPRGLRSQPEYQAGW